MTVGCLPIAFHGAVRRLRKLLPGDKSLVKVGVALIYKLTTDTLAELS